MNNRHLCNYFFVKLSLSVLLLTGTLAQVKADTLYGPLRAGETLSSIVNQNYLTSPYDDSVIMKEILRMNPQAFISNNVGLIKQGVTLTLPSDATLRSSQSQGNNTRIVQSAATSAGSALALSLEATLTQVRGERDQANLRIQRIESESATQLEALNSKVKRLESEKQTFSRQLATSTTELAGLKKSLDDLKQRNSQSDQEVAVVTTDNKTLAQLEESKTLVAQKQQQIVDLESSILTINNETDRLKSSQETTISNLQASNQALEEKLTLQNQEASNSSDTSEQVAAKTATLNLQHQQAIDDLNSSFKDQLSEQEKSQSSLNAQINDLKASSESQDLQIIQLNDENKELASELTAAKASLEAALAENLSVREQVITDLGTVDSIQTIDSDPLISGPLTKQLIAQELRKPVAFPLWGLLLGAFALGFTSLMMFFTRSRKQVSVSSAPSSDMQATEDVRIEPLVFRKGDSSMQDPDIETLRVPPRRDPSRVAIMDPTMAASAVTAVAASTAAATQIGSPDAGILTAPLAEDLLVGDSQQFDSKLKLLIAETYTELGDTAAASELLTEVSNEGNHAQITDATKLIAQLSQ